MINIEEHLTISSERTILEAMACIDRNSKRVVFIEDASGRIIASLSDGDIRRFLLEGGSLEASVGVAMNRDFAFATEGMDSDDVASLITDRVTVVPVLKADGSALKFLYGDISTFIPTSEPNLQGNELAYVVDCVKSGWISSQGEYVRQFESSFAEYVGVPVDRVISVSNGTVGLHLALAALGIGVGDEVIVPDLTFAATANAVLHVGAQPVIVDVDPESFVLEREAVIGAITPATRAIMPVHLYGQMCDMVDMRALAKERGLLIIEDAAEALGSAFMGASAGTFGDAGVFSFFANKLITTGEGGMVVFRDSRQAKIARILRDHGMSPDKKYWHLYAGFNFRLTNLQAAIGLAQMERINDLLEGKIQLAKTYSRILGEFSSIVELPEPLPNVQHSYWSYVLRFKEDVNFTLQEAIDFMGAHGIELRRVFYPLHLMPPYEKLRRLGDCEHSTLISRTGLLLPASTKITEFQAIEIAETLARFLEMKHLQKLTYRDQPHS